MIALKISNPQAKQLASHFTLLDIVTYCEENIDRYIAYLQQATDAGDKQAEQELAQLVYGRGLNTEKPLLVSGDDTQPP